MCKLHILLVSLYLLSSNVTQAATQLESKSVLKSNYYTGKTEAANIPYTALDDWLRYRSEDDLAKDIYNRGFIVDDPAVVKPLYKIANQLLENWPGTVPKFSIFVRSDTAAPVYGAEALIANEILIYYGTLKNIDSDDELAAIIAHELSHILLGHNKKASYISTALQLFDDYESIKNLRDTVRAGSIIKTGDNQYDLKFDGGLEEDIVKASEQKKRAAELYYAYHSSALGRPAEVKADLLAADLLIAAGYSPLGLHKTLNKLSSSYTVEKFVSESMAEFSSKLLEAVELSMTEQLSSFESQIKSIDSDTKADIEKADTSTIFGTFLFGMKERLKTSATEFAWKRFKTRHPVPKKRISSLVNYLDENYSIKERLKPTNTSFLKQYRRSGLRQIASYEKLKFASISLIEGSIDQAASQSIASLNGSKDSDPYKRYTTYRIRRDQKEFSSAITNIERIKGFHSVPTNSLIDMLDLLIENKRFTFAKKVIGQKEGFGYKVPDLYPSKIEIALAGDNKEQAIDLTNECLENKSAMKETRNMCASYGVLAPEETIGKTGGIFGGLKSVTSSLSNSLNSKKNDKETKEE